MAATAKKPVPDNKRGRADLALELIELRLKNAVPFDRMDAIKAELKRRAEEDGKFREDVPGKGYVSASPGTPERKIGDAPALQIAAWDQLTPNRRERLEAEGLVAMQAIIKGAYYGRVDVKLFAPPSGAAK